MTDDGARDERLSRLLEVEPLDDLTRRRLVSTALRASSPPARRTSRLVAAVAAATLVVAGGIGLLVVSDDGGSVPTANRSRGGQPLDKSAEAAPTPSAAPASTSVVGGSTAQSAVAVRDVGDLGDLADPAALDHAREALAPAGASTFGGTDANEARASDRLVARARAASCASALSEGTVVAVGTGTYGGRDAVVLAIEQDDGTQVVEAVVLDPCEIRPLD